jgi:exodeoxyribonuclease VII large subunit
MSKKDDYISVGDFNSLIKELLVENLSDVVKVKGEVSNFKFSNGNTFFTLKDKDSSISVVSWRTQFDVVNGDDIFVTGRLVCYTKQGTYNIQATKAERIGIGNLYETYEKLKNTFYQQGLFSKERDFPTTINRIGIITSYEGAALQDILYVLKSNSFSGDVLIKNCYVQGNSCTSSVKYGIEYFNGMKNKVDLILITRGGGSFEDLMGYSAEIVVRSIYNSEIYTISAVGHETDTMLSDYVADYRAPTPSIAAEKISDAEKHLVRDFSTCCSNMMSLKSLIVHKLDSYQRKIENQKRVLSALNPIKYIETELNNLIGIKHNIYNKIKHRLDNIHHKLESLRLENESFDIINNFNKGFVMIIDENGAIIKNAKEFKLLKGKQKLKIIFADGEVIL